MSSPVPTGMPSSESQSTRAQTADTVSEKASVSVEDAGKAPPTPPVTRVTLPTPPSFSAHRKERAAQTTASSPPKASLLLQRSLTDAPPRANRDDPGLAAGSPSDNGPASAVYRIPQRQSIGGEISLNSPFSPGLSPRSIAVPRNPPFSLSTASAQASAGPGKPSLSSSLLSPRSKASIASHHHLRLNTAPFRPMTLEPLKTAPTSSRRWSIDPAPGGKVASNAQTKKQAPGAIGPSIWSASGLTSAGLGAAERASGWASPALPSARSVSALGGERTRGLSIAVLKEDKEMVLEGPLSPGQGCAVSSGNGSGSKSPASVSTQRKASITTTAAETPRTAKTVILCRYYHTPGLTCTSRPCRFVHNLDSLPELASNPADVLRLRMLSPAVAQSDSLDPTSGTFAHAQQQRQQPRRGSGESLAAGDHIEPGANVVVTNEAGEEVLGTIFLMSGGGKGPAGKSKAKFKTMPCKDFALGQCSYGDYCSFIHDEKPPAPSAELPKPKPRPKSFDGAALSKTALNAWTKPLPVAIRSPGCLSPPVQAEEHVSAANQEAVKEETARFDATLERIEETLKRKDTLAPIPEQAEADSPFSKEAQKPVKQVTILEPTSDHASCHLEPPSAFSAFGTESDPATPWDPALQARKMADVEDETHVTRAAAPAVFQNPAYPWGMPMSPLAPGPELVPEYAWDAVGKDTSFASLTGSAVWTPAGWTVPDAAAQYPKASSRRHPKSYYRTKPCKFFAEGKCPHGERCTYLHEVPSEASSSDGERPLPQKYRTVPCKFFNSARGCTNGDACHFLHELVVPPQAPLVPFPRAWRTRPCRHYQLGRCTLGDACHFAHVFEGEDGRSRARQSRQPTSRIEPDSRDGGVALTEEGLREAAEQMRSLEVKGPVEEDEESDDLEIVTEQTISSVRSSSVAA